MRLIHVPLGQQRHARLSAFRWGLYAQLRWGLVWRHLTAKCFRQGPITWRKYGIFIGWWKTTAGERGRASGLRFMVERVRLHRAGRTTNLPVPHKAREEERA